MLESSSNPLVLREPDNAVGRKLWPYLAAGMVSLFALFTMGFSGLWVALIVSIGAAYIERERLQAALRWRPPQLALEEAVHPLGSQPVLTYRRRFRNQVIDLSSCRVDCRLVCEERATYRQGSSTRTDTEVVFEHSFSAQGEGTANGLVAPLVVEIPATAGSHTFDLGSNEVRWYLETRVDGAAKAPRDKNIFVLDVGPVLDARFTPRVQDS